MFVDRRIPFDDIYLENDAAAEAAAASFTNLVDSWFNYAGTLSNLYSPKAGDFASLICERSVVYLQLADHEYLGMIAAKLHKIALWDMLDGTAKRPQTEAYSVGLFAFPFGHLSEFCTYIATSTDEEPDGPTAILDVHRTDWDSGRLLPPRVSRYVDTPERTAAIMEERDQGLNGLAVNIQDIDGLEATLSGGIVFLRRPV